MKRKSSLVTQILVFFIAGVLLTAALSYFTIKRIAENNVLREKQALSAGILADVESMIREYDAYEWVLGYLIEHRDDGLDLEYEKNDLTRVKESELLRRHEGLVLKAASAQQLDAFPEEDQRAYAEIVFNYWLLRMNEMKRVYNAAYLYFLASDDSFEESIFIITASDGTRERGTGPENSYILGKTVQNIPDQTAAFKGLKEGEDHLVYTDGLMDRYRYLYRIGDMNVLTGMTFEVAAIEQDVAKQTLQGINNFSVLQILLSVFCLFLIYLFAIRPLQKVRMNVLEYGDTKDSAKVKAQLEMISSNNEIGELAEGVSEMITEIDEHLEYIQSITAEKERISTELELATNIQTSMLPHIFPAFPGRSEFDIYASMDPAKEVGGDFYDYFLVDDDHLCMVIADVSGKGIPAALFMMISKIILQNCTMLGQTASQVLAKTNDIICSNNEAEMFVTVWLGILELSTGRMTAANAGHEYPAIRRAGGSFALFIDKHDFVIGAFEGIKYHEYELQLQPGDKLFVYTDGVPEATNAEKELFGTDRMLGALNTDPEAGPHDILMNVQGAVDSFVGEAEQFDDLTMLCMEYKGKQDR